MRLFLLNLISIWISEEGLWDWDMQVDDCEVGAVRDFGWV